MCRRICLIEFAAVVFVAGLAAPLFADADKVVITRDGKEVSVGSPGSLDEPSEEAKSPLDRKERLLPGVGSAFPATRPAAMDFPRPFLPTPTGPQYTVIGVFGTDGIIVYDGTRRARVRYFGVRSPKRQSAVAGSAVQRHREMVMGKKVRLAFTRQSSGRYRPGERQAYVFLQSDRAGSRDRNLLVNAFLVENGYAAVDAVSLPSRHRRYFKQLQRLARVRSAGIWAPRKSAEEERAIQPPAEKSPEEKRAEERLNRVRRARRPIAFD